MGQYSVEALGAEGGVDSRRGNCRLEACFSIVDILEYRGGQLFCILWVIYRFAITVHINRQRGIT